MSKKELIMEKALELFSNEGYESSGVLRIVQAAEVTKPTLYHYFGSKEGLLTSLYETYFYIFLESIEKVLPYNNDIINTMERLIKVYIDFAKENTRFFWLAYHLRKGPLQSQSRIIVQRFHDDEQALILRLMKSVSEHHTNLKGHEAFLASAYLSLVNGFIEIKIDQDELKDVKQEDIYKLSKQYLYGIFSL